MAKPNNHEGKVPSEESEERASKLSEIIKTTELGKLDSKKSNLKNHTPKKPPTPKPKPKSVVLTEDCFGLFHGDRGPPQKIKRFTWKNHNNIEVQIITYGARISSIKLPNRKGVVEDVIIGCRDLAGYLQYEDFYLGATIGRVTNKIENSTFAIDGVQYWVQSNDGKDQINGGSKGFDKVVWEPYVQGNTVILSHTSPHGDEGFSGDLLVRISFELSPKSEFSINMEAVTTKTTIINLSNLTYFNLAGHQAGPEEIYRHTVTINSNCFTVNKENGLPTGEIMNLVYTKYDFQIPSVLKTCIGIEPDDGYDQNFCVNRGVDQGNCFVARALHTPSGRILEIYSNQHGVNFSTANHFGSGLVDIPVETEEIATKTEEPADNIFFLLDLLYEKVSDSDYDETNITQELRDLLKRIQKCEIESFKQNPSAMLHALNMTHPDFDFSLRLSDIELSYLRHIKGLAERVKRTTNCEQMQRIITEILDTALAMDKVTSNLSNVYQSNTTLSVKSPGKNGNGNVIKSNGRQSQEVNKRNGNGNVIKSNGRKSQEVNKRNGSDKVVNGSKTGVEKMIKSEILCGEDFKSRTDTMYEMEMERKGMIQETNVIPTFYKDGRLHGKNGAVYKRHGAIAFQTQNYPNAIYHKNFPSCVLNPGETYRHTIVYKFWVQRGNPMMWNKRNCS